MTIHGLAGLPRSGSTLLANILDQHPDVHVSGTSALPRCVEVVSGVLSHAEEVQSDLANVPGAYGRYVSALRGMAEGWYADRHEPHIIDKGRGWILHRALLDQIEPGSVLIVCVRDPRDVIASIDRAHRATAVFESPLARTVYDAADLLMKQDGMVGGPMHHIEDLLRRRQQGVVWVPYESLVAAPEAALERVAQALGLTSFAWDFEDVQNAASDLDAIYRGKYPHDASGPIKATGRSWHDVLDRGLAEQIASVSPLYMQTFGYTAR